MGKHQGQSGGRRNERTAGKGLCYRSGEKLLSGAVPYWAKTETQMSVFVIGEFVIQFLHSLKRWIDVNNFGHWSGPMINECQIIN